MIDKYAPYPSTYTKEDIEKYSTNKEELKNAVTEEKYDKIKASIVIKDSFEKAKRLLIFDDVFDATVTAIY